MFNITIICIGTLKEKYLTDAVAEYSKRMQTLCKFNIVELQEEKLPDNPSQTVIDNALKKETEKIKAKIPKSADIVTLCIEGKQISSEQLAKKIMDCSVKGISSICFIIGSSFGLSNEIKQMSNFKLSMSPMTFPHQLARVMLCEQVYRAFQINNNSKYHK